MFPREKRVSRDDFPKILASRRRLSSAHFSVTLAATPDGVATVVAKRIVPTSVGRHRLKRRILAILRGLKHLPAPGVIVFAKSGSPALSYTELKKELITLLGQK